MAKKKKKYKKRTWTTSEGDIIRIKNMTTMHIMNAIALVENIKSKEEQIEWLKEELNIRLGITMMNEGPVENRWDILDIQKDDKNDIGDNIW